MTIGVLRSISFRDISAFMKRNNVVGSSAGFVERICESYSHVDISNVSIGINGYSLLVSIELITHRLVSD